MRKKRKTKKKAWGVHRLPPYPVRVADPVGQGHHGRQVQASPSAADTCCVLLDLRRERLGDTVVVAPIVVETWTQVVARMTGVISFRTTDPMPPYTVRGRVHPIRGGGCCGGRPRDSQLHPRALRVPRAMRKFVEGVRRSHAYVTMVGQGGDCS
jgi:hypothetical protein